MKVHNNGDAVRSSEDMAALVAAYRKSNWGLRRFAREHNLPPGRLHYWVYQKRQNSRPRALARGRSSELPPGFQEVTLGLGSALIESWAAEVRLPGGVNVRFERTAAPDWIGAVVQALHRSC